MTPDDLRRSGDIGPRMLTVSRSGSVKYRQQKINVGILLRGQKVRVTEEKDFVTVHLVDGERLPQGSSTSGPSASITLAEGAAS